MPDASRSNFPPADYRVIVPYAAGGGSDISARLLARDLEPILGKPVTVENRAGGGGWVGWGALAASKPDGYTIGYINAPSMFAGYLDKQQGGSRKENLESFTPLINHVVDLQSLGGAARQQVQDRQGRHRRRQEAARARSRSTAAAMAPTITSRRWASAPTPERASRWCISAARPKARPRCWAATSRCSHATSARSPRTSKAGQFRMLGVMSAERSTFIPNAPTFREQGFNEVWSVSRGIAAPAGLPKDVEAALIGYLEKTIASTEHKAKAEALALDPQIIKGDAYRKFLKDNEQATKKLMNW